MEYVKSGDTEKLSSLTNRGLDPNFIDRLTGGMESRANFLSFV